MYDIIIIGGGPGGYELALRACKHFKVLLIEKEQIGGTCLHSGCIPTKTLYHIAQELRSINAFKEKGIHTDFRYFNLEEALTYQQNIITKLHNGMLLEIKNKNIDVIYGVAKFNSSNQVIVNDNIYQGQYIVIATGSLPIKLNLPGFDNDKVIDSKKLLHSTKVPKRLLIIGAGVIGVELAGIYHAFGSEIVIVERESNILPNFDREISKRLQTYLKKDGIKIITNESVQEIIAKENTLVVRLNHDEIEIDSVLVAVGRKPNIYDLDLEKAGINYNKKGIIVDEELKTNVDNVFAIGDCNGRYQLAYAASFEAKKVLNIILGKSDSINFNNLPSCVFTFPEVSSVGLTEEDCQNQNIEYQSYKYLFRANGKALTMDHSEGFIKVLVSNDKILGVHIIGPLASELIHEANLAINTNISLSEFLDIIHIHPTLTEIYLDALKNHF